MKDYKFKINEKVRNMTLIGTIIDAQLNEFLGVVYLVKYENGEVLWAIESSLEKVE